MATASRQRKGGLLSQYTESIKKTGRLLPDVQRHLLTVTSDRAQDVIHPSEISDPEWCPRALYHRLRGLRPTLDRPHFQLDNIFDEGHAIHEKWQSRWRAMGVLWGNWRCLQCKHQWLDLSPNTCPRCGAVPELIRYAEIPLRSLQHNIAGHADGEVRDAQGNVMIEIKSVGEGTVRVEAPKLVAAHTLKVTDDDGVQRTLIDHARLWRELRRPFSKHLRQGWIYLALREMYYPNEPKVDGIDFIYEYKATQAVKEMHARIDRDSVKEILADCLDLMHDVKTGREPWCRAGRREECAYCAPYVKEASGGRGGTQTERTGARGDDQPSPAKRGTVIPRRPRPAGRSTPAGAGRPVRAGRPRPDESADEAQQMGGLLWWSTGARGS